MLLFFNKIIDEDKKIIYTLKDIYGLNIKISYNICNDLGINPLTKLKNIPISKINLIKLFIDKNLVIEDELKQQKLDLYRKLIDMKTYKSIRHTWGLPVNGQRTRTNRKTARKFKNKWIKQENNLKF